MRRSLPASLRPALEAYATQLRTIFGVRVAELRLFGSYARGDAHEDSDVDVLVLIDRLTNSELGLAAGAVAEVIGRTGLPLAPLPMATEHFAELRRQGRALALDIDEQGISL